MSEIVDGVVFPAFTTPLFRHCCCRLQALGLLLPSGSVIGTSPVTSVIRICGTSFLQILFLGLSASSSRLSFPAVLLTRCCPEIEAIPLLPQGGISRLLQLPHFYRLHFKYRHRVLVVAVEHAQAFSRAAFSALRNCECCGLFGAWHYCLDLAVVMWSNTALEPSRRELWGSDGPSLVAEPAADQRKSPAAGCFRGGDPGTRRQAAEGNPGHCAKSSPSGSGNARRPGGHRILKMLFALSPRPETSSRALADEVFGRGAAEC